MVKTAYPGAVSGTIRIPASKSHTIRGLIIASLAAGKSRLISPLKSADTDACINACRALGADIEENKAEIIVSGVDGSPTVPANVIDVANSGTTLYLAAGFAALAEGLTVFTGDYQIRSRPAGPLLTSLNDLGARAESTRRNGAAPLIVGGGIAGGETTIQCQTSQYLSSLLLCSPLAKNDVTIHVPLLNERPYVDITLGWLRSQDIRIERDEYRTFRIPANQRYRSFEASMPGDFSSATFFLCAAAICGSTIRIEGLDMSDSQGDKAIVGFLERMGCTLEINTDGTEPAIMLTGGSLVAGEFDLNATPDALPALAVTACFADGETRLVNVPQAREKETDRISVMHEQLVALGADVEELAEGLIIRGRSDMILSPGTVDGYTDHRIVMALAIAALRASGPVDIQSAESAAVTFPTFFTLLDEVRTNE
jgi:3-phosphoshikimate 1-carboxyvinyltransferase